MGFALEKEKPQTNYDRNNIEPLECGSNAFLDSVDQVFEIKGSPRSTDLYVRWALPVLTAVSLAGLVYIILI